ncbi:MAG: hypothetical protein BEN18_09815 [Epulopiscium sp. Nuni2H_MBin001]|nr:MAG: hypothetical protein BEN18_09815 [Epulopiscium sp. Nuni2H_MBin001]
MKINYNIPALQTNVALKRATNQQSTAMERLSSGLKINSSKDDPAGMAICQKLTAQVDGLNQANKNSMDGISMIQTAEGAMNEVHDMLSRLRELSIQSMNDTYTDTDRDKMQLELNELLKEIDRISEDTEFNDTKILNGSRDIGQSGIGIVQTQTGTDDQPAVYNLTLPNPRVAGEGFTIDGQAFEFYDSTEGEYTGTAIGLDINNTAAQITNTLAEIEYTNFTLSTDLTLTAKSNGTDGNYLAANDGAVAPIQVLFQIGANANQLTSLYLESTGTDVLGLTSNLEGNGFSETADINGAYGLNISNKEDADFALGAIDKAINKISEQRAYLGAYQNRLEYTVKSLDVTEDNLTGSLSRIQDTDMAEEMTEFTRTNIISQAATSMLSQANQRPQQVLQILQS